MDTKLRDAQLRILAVFAKKAKDFALCGGTALELYYLKHRFSADLDFFSPYYDAKEIESLTLAFKEQLKARVKLETEFLLPARAKVRFYTISIKGTKRPLKIDFVEEVLIKKPKIEKFDGVRVYGVKDIYMQKISTVTGNQVFTDEIGRQILEGRRQAKDAFDIYMLSKNVMPLHKFVKNVPERFQRGMVHWYRTFSRQDLKEGLLDLDIYTKGFNSHEMIIYLENEIKQFVKEAI